MRKGSIYSICIGPKMGMEKQEVQEAMVTRQGIENDGNACEWGRKWGRQISCLNLQSVLSACEENSIAFVPGVFDENILVDGFDLYEMSVGDQMKLGKDVILEVTQFGRESHLSPISTTSLLSYEGVFCKVIKGGTIRKGDSIEYLCRISGIGGSIVGESS